MSEVPVDVIQKIEAGYKKLQVKIFFYLIWTKKKFKASPDCHSLLKKYLTLDVVEQCKNKKTKLGATFLDVIQSGKMIFFIMDFYNL